MAKRSKKPSIYICIIVWTVAKFLQDGNKAMDYMAKMGMYQDTSLE